MIAQRVEDALTTGMRKVHILVGKGAPIFTRAEIESGNQAAFVMDGQYPANHRHPIHEDLYARWSF